MMKAHLFCFVYSVNTSFHVYKHKHRYRHVCERLLLADTVGHLTYWSCSNINNISIKCFVIIQCSSCLTSRISSTGSTCCRHVQFFLKGRRLCPLLCNGKLSVSASPTCVCMSSCGNIHSCRVTGEGGGLNTDLAGTFIYFAVMYFTACRILLTLYLSLFL